MAQHLHPMSSIQIARLASKLVSGGHWEDPSRVQARDDIQMIERIATFGPGEESGGAYSMSGLAMRLRMSAVVALPLDYIAEHGEELSWLTDPFQMDAANRQTYVY